MKPRRLVTLVCAAALAGVLGVVAAPRNSGWKIIAWNDLGMHCMDGDYSVFAVLPPFNTIRAQVIDPSGQRVEDEGDLTVTYEAVADSTGSVNSTSVGKTGFWEHVLALFGVAPAVDVGLTGAAMPGTGNTPQPLDFHASEALFTTEGIPITPVDDAWRRNAYPMMRVSVRDAGNQVLASTDIVLPVSDEMDCGLCHGSGTVAEAEPSGGWVFDCETEQDFKRNILALHDDLHVGDASFAAALATAGYDPAGLVATVDGGTPILCARCHGSNALPGTGVVGVSPLTRAVHSLHANVEDPLTGLELDDATLRAACYRCHPGAETRCLRGAMGDAVADDGAAAMQCQSCHGSMSRVGADDREGWLEQPTCQGCHTGTATDNNGRIRYESVFEPGGTPRVAVNDTFATDQNTPGPGLSLYRFSEGHGGLQCEACHGSTHAIYPSSHANDNVASLDLQGHVGSLTECTACHGTMPDTVVGGPHGLHPIGAGWVEDHGDVVEANGPDDCRDCHGQDLRGTVLSHAADTRTFSTSYGQKHVWRGFRVGCWDCHNGPDDDDPNPNSAPLASDGAASTSAGTAVVVPLVANDANGDPLEYRVVSQAALGSVAVAGSQATYQPRPGNIGVDSFTFAARDGDTDSNLATVSIGVFGSFSDVPPSHWAGSWIQRLYEAEITAGCSDLPMQFCPTGTVTRAEMAVFLVRGRHGSDFTPPPASGQFADVPVNHWAAPWIEQLAADGVTAGCAPGLYCPDAPTSRAEIAVFLVRAASFDGCVPDDATGTIFSDVPAGYWAASWIERLVKEGVTAGCGGGMYCPESPLTRAEMGVFLVRTFSLP